MANKPHLKFLNKRQLSEVKTFKYNYGGGEDDKKEKPDYHFMAQNFKSNLLAYQQDYKDKYEKKDMSIDIPYDIDYIQIVFQAQFDITRYFDKYYNDYGLEATSFIDFGTKGLFAVINRDKFEGFVKQIEHFIAKELDGDENVKYSRNVKYIKEFKLLTTSDILKFQLEKIGGIVYLSLINLRLEEKIKQEIVQALFEYLNSIELEYNYDENTDRLELKDITSNQLEKIIENFDVVESATCSAFTTIRPSGFGTPERVSGFEINNLNEDLPIIGIIDTGISKTTALGPLIIEDDSFTLVGTSPFIDGSGGVGHGHGTAVAGLAALGRENHQNDFSGSVKADAKLLSIKITNGSRGYISESGIIDLLYKAKEKYPLIRLFTLTTCYNENLKTNESFSDYTYALDKFAYETNSIIFIATGNNSDSINDNADYDLNYFSEEKTNICSPADSMNNITVGAAADNLNSGVFQGISKGKEFPALYTRKSHIDLSLLYSTAKSNKNLFKPDVVNSGGDIGFYNANTLDWMDPPALTLLSAQPNLGVFKEIGTSFSTPLTANLAAKIIKSYPELNNETVKALIINGASLDLIKFDNNIEKLQNKVAGHGFVNDFRGLHSTDDSVTLILEDSIKDNDIKIYPINIPGYFLTDEKIKRESVLKITMTLCYKFMPIKGNQLSYNPIHMAFSIFKNHNADEIMLPEGTKKSKFRSNLSWSENGRFKSKPIPFSNLQKVIVKTVAKKDLRENSNVLKLAIHSFLTKQIIGGIPHGYPKEFPFSIVLNIEELGQEKTNKLYDEIEAINFVEALGSIDIDTELDLDVNN